MAPSRATLTQPGSKASRIGVVAWRGHGLVRRNCIGVEVVTTAVGVKAVRSLGQRARARLVCDDEAECDAVNGGGAGTEKGAVGYR
jgi:hypothetical protein